MRLSVIIPCKNEVGTVEKLLDSIVAQSLQPFEVIVVDSGSDDDLASTVRAYKQQLPIRMITATKKGVIHARNQGAGNAKGDILLFLDADVVLPANFLDATIAQMHTRQFDVVGYYQRMQSDRAEIRAGARAMNGYVRIMSRSRMPVVFSCMAAAKAVHDTIGGFDPDVWIMEDYDYAHRAIKHGFTFGVAKGTFFRSSDRRFRTDASTSIFQGIYAELYRYTHGLRITRPLFTYRMGGKKKRANESSSR